MLARTGGTGQRSRYADGADDIAEQQTRSDALPPRRRTAVHGTQQDLDEGVDGHQRNPKRLTVEWQPSHPCDSLQHQASLHLACGSDGLQMSPECSRFILDFGENECRMPKCPNAECWGRVPPLPHSTFGHSDIRTFAPAPRSVTLTRSS